VEEVDVAPPSYSTNVPPPPSPEEQAALTAEKRAALEILQSTYEREITNLGQTEQKLLIKRLAEIRQQAIDDIPARFEPVLEALDEEGDKMVGKLGRYFTKVSGDEKKEIEEKVEESQRLSEKAKVKVDKMKKKVEEEIEQYRVGLVTKEETAVEEAKNSITTLVGKAQVRCDEICRLSFVLTNFRLSLFTGGTWIWVDLARRRDPQGLAAIPRTSEGGGELTQEFLEPTIRRDPRFDSFLARPFTPPRQVREETSTTRRRLLRHPQQDHDQRSEGDQRGMDRSNERGSEGL